MSAGDSFTQALTVGERSFMATLKSPNRIQAFLDDLPYSPEMVYRCPLRVLRDRSAHCFDGALFAAVALRRLGHAPLILELLPCERDDDHLIAIYKQNGHWGAIAKSNFVGLRFREPIYRNLRELVLSYFEQYYNVQREKTLRGYTRPLNLQRFDGLDWAVKDDPLEEIAKKLDRGGRSFIVNAEMAKNLSFVDSRSYLAGLMGANKKGLFMPGLRSRRGLQESKG